MLRNLACQRPRMIVARSLEKLARAPRRSEVRVLGVRQIGAMVGKA